MAQRVQEEVGFEIKEEMLWEVLRVRGSFATVVGKVHDLIRSSDPVPIASTHDNLLMWLNPVPLNIDDLLVATDAVNMLYEELRERVEKGVGVVEKGAPRIFAILPSHHADPRLEHLVNEVGMAIVASDVEFTSSSSMPASTLAMPKGPYEAMSQYLQSSLLLHLNGRISIILEACKRLNVDGVLNHYHVGCRSVAGDALIIKDAITKSWAYPFSYSNGRTSTPASIIMSNIRQDWSCSSQPFHPQHEVALLSPTSKGRACRRRMLQ